MIRYVLDCDGFRSGETCSEMGGRGHHVMIHDDDNCLWCCCSVVETRINKMHRHNSSLVLSRSFFVFFQIFSIYSFFADDSVFARLNTIIWIVIFVRNFFFIKFSSMKNEFAEKHEFFRYFRQNRTKARSRASSSWNTIRYTRFFSQQHGWTTNRHDFKSGEYCFAVVQEVLSNTSLHLFPVILSSHCGKKVLRGSANELSTPLHVAANVVGPAAKSVQQDDDWFWFGGCHCHKCKHGMSHMLCSIFFTNLGQNRQCPNACHHFTLPLFQFWITSKCHIAFGQFKQNPLHGKIQPVVLWQKHICKTIIGSLHFEHWTLIANHFFELAFFTQKSETSASANKNQCFEKICGMCENRVDNFCHPRAVIQA